MKVFGYTLGDRRRIVAAASQAAAARAFDIPASRLAKYGCETGNPTEIALATGKPGTVFYQPTFGTLGQPYTEE